MGPTVRPETSAIRTQPPGINQEGTNYKQQVVDDLVGILGGGGMIKAVRNSPCMRPWQCSYSLTDTSTVPLTNHLTEQRHYILKYFINPLIMNYTFTNKNLNMPLWVQHYLILLICLVSAVALTPGGSNTVHVYT